MTTLRNFGEIFGVTRSTANLPRMAAAAVVNGFAVLPVYPNSKVPICTFTRAEVKKDPKHPCGVYHAITNEAEALKVFRRLQRVYPKLNIAIEVGCSQMVLVDCDSAASVQAFSDRFKLPVPLSPTVYTPGTVVDGRWTHKNGGHYWFALPNDLTFTNAASATPLKQDGYEVYFKDRVALMPPSDREEGSYVLASELTYAPNWLLEQIHSHISNIQLSSRHTNDDPIDEWASNTTWNSILHQDGWAIHGTDRCGCNIYTRPGPYSNPKSATAHDNGCSRLPEDQLQGPLHIWTDNPPDFLADYVQETGNKTISKLQYIAWRDHNGDIAQAMHDLDIEAIDDSVLALLDSIPRQPKL